MAIFKTTVTAYRCERCGYEWLPRVAGAPLPAVCPNGQCKSLLWNTPRPPVRPRKRPAPSRRLRPSRWQTPTAPRSARSPPRFPCTRPAVG